MIILRYKHHGVSYKLLDPRTVTFQLVVFGPTVAVLLLSQNGTVVKALCTTVRIASTVECLM